MDLRQTESVARYVRPTVVSEASKKLRPVESTRSIGPIKAGKSLASVRREINKSISVELDEALREGKATEEQIQSTVFLDSYPNTAEESLHSFKAALVYEKLKKSDSFKSLVQSASSQTLGKLTQKSTSSEEVKKPIEEAKSEEEIAKLLGNFITDVENLSSIVKIANDFVDDILNESRRIVRGKTEQPQDKKELIPIKDLCFQTEETLKENPSMFVLANDFVESILNESVRRAMNLKFLDIDRFQNYSSLNDFKVKDGLEIVAKCMSKWSFNSNWYYRTIYKGRQILDSHLYFYVVRWSVPTPSYPIAQVTVDVNFVIEVVPLMKFPFYIEVWYRVETDRSQHCAFDSRFLEKWLKTVVQRKLQTYKKFNF